MPAVLERCVTKLLADPNFKPKGGDKKSSAFAVCTASLKKANKMNEDLDSMTAFDIMKLSMDEKDLSYNLSYSNSVKLHERMVHPLVEIFAGEDGKLPKKIQIMPVGEWDTVPYGKLTITHDDISQMVDNFEQGVRAGDTLPIDVDHDGKEAAGWMTALKAEDDGLWASVEWTALGEKLLGEKRYKFFSPEFNPEYTDPENKKVNLKNVLIAGSLVNRPLFKELQPLIASDQLTGKKTGVMLFIEHMDYKELLKKKTAGEKLTADEDAFVNANAKASEEDAEAEAEKKKEEEVAKKKASEEEAKAEAAKKDEAKKGKESLVTISASELRKLKEDSLAGVAALEMLEKKEVAETIDSWMFSENGGHFQPAIKDDLTSFYTSLDKTQRATFTKLVDNFPKQDLLFKEIGSSEVMTKSQAKDQLTVKAQELVDKEKDAGRRLTLGEAVKRVLRSDPDLNKHLNEGLIPVTGKVARPLK